MAKLGARLTLLELMFGLAITAVVLRAAQLQLLQGAHWRDLAERDRRAREVLPARRGSILDRNGVALAVTQEYYHVGIAPDQVDDRRQLMRLVAKNLELPLARVQQDFGAGRKYIYYHGPFTGLQVQPLRALSGVHLEGEFARQYPAGPLARPVIGSLKPDSGTGASGLELALDSVLVGEPGEEVVLKDRAGRRYESPARVVREPVPGHDVQLTLDAELQEIAERGLEEAIGAMHARGGDVVFMDPKNGELMALASRQAVDGKLVSGRAGTFTDPFEPGSTAKLFTAAALLTLGRVDSTDQVFAENGHWLMPISAKVKPRVIDDAHKTTGSLTLAQAIQVSSNIAMAKFSLRLRPEEQYDALRDFGFGSPTGVEFPSESRGRLSRPDRWKDRLSGPSVAMGYEFGVTPIQLAAAYGAIANDGILLTPALVRWIRSPAGKLVYHHRPEPVRRVVSSEVAARLREFLRGAVGEGGTGERAQLVNYSLLGKTGTAVRFEDGHYVPGTYYASFAALFPAENPQLIVIVKIDDPKGEYYGGLTAAPLTRRMLQQALASQRSALDRGALTAPGPADVASTRAVEPEVEESTAVVPWPGVRAKPARPGPLPVPDVVGASARRAAVALHRRGFQVALHGTGTVLRTWPAPGDSTAYGGTVSVWTQ